MARYCERYAEELDFRRLPLAGAEVGRSVAQRWQKEQAVVEITVGELTNPRSPTASEKGLS